MKQELVIPQGSFTAESLATTLIQVMESNFDMRMFSREERQGTKVTKAAILMLQDDIMTSAGDKFNQGTFDNIVATIFGDNEEMKLEPVMVAQTMAQLFPAVPKKPQAAIKFLVNYYDQRMGETQEEEQVTGTTMNSDQYLQSVQALVKGNNQEPEIPNLDSLEEPIAN